MSGKRVASLVLLAGRLALGCGVYDNIEFSRGV
jgi:hypothetical protein